MDYHRKPSGRSSVFLRRRLLRIAPLYWAVTTAMMIVLLTAPGLQHTARLKLAHISASYLFVPWPHPPPYEGAYSLLVPGRTLNYEVFVYVLFAIGLTVARRIRGGLIFTTLAALFAIGRVWPDAPLILRVYTLPIILEFGLGVAIAMLADYSQMTKVDPRLPSLLLLANGCTCFLLFAADEPTGAVRLFHLGMPAAMIVAGAVIWERARIVRLMPPVLLFGDASYAIVLTHTPLLAALAVALNGAGLLATHPAAFIVLRVAASIVVGIIVHLLLERPLATMLGRRWGRPTVVASGEPVH